MHLIFLRNGGDYSEALQQIREVITRTKGKLRIAVAYFNHTEIAELLLQRKERQEETHILLNSSDLVRPVEGTVEYEISAPLMRLVRESHRDRHFQLRTLGLPFPDYFNMHHKFAVGDDKVIFGSVNWTRPALAHNYELLVIDDRHETVEKFAGEFDAIWDDAHVLDGSREGLRVVVCPLCKSAGSVDFESYGAHCMNCGSEFRPRPKVR